MNRQLQPRRLALLGILLQILHLLFGITAVIGVLIAHVNLPSAQGTVYLSQLRWQIITFWAGLAGYGAAIWVWLEHGSSWPVFVVLLFVIYRVLVSMYYWHTQREIQRIL